jgi:hypothetical protein
MSKLSKNQRTVAYVVVGLLAAYLAYRWYTGRQTSASNTTGSTAAPDTTSSDYAALAGQEQGDVAALQDQNTQLMSQEQSDVAALQAQEGADVAGINQGISGFSNTVDQLTSQLADVVGAQSELGQEIAALASGHKSTDRTKHQMYAVHRGGPFWHYYKRVTGHAPPAHIAVTNWIYQAWKQGVNASRLHQAHPSSKNRHVAHPNGNHQPKTGTHRKLSGQHKQPPKASKPKKSGAHR